MSYFLGMALAFVVSVAAAVIGFDKDRVFYPTVLIVIASYYVLFAAMGATSTALLSEVPAAVLFMGLAVFGFKRSPWLLVLGLAAHGVFDRVHPALVTNPGVPVWWPDFCLAYDLIAAACLAFRLRSTRRAGVASLSRGQ